MIGVRLVKRLAVEEERLVLQVEMVAGNAHGAFHEGLRDIHGVTEDDDVAALDLVVRQQVTRDRTGGRVGKLVHQQVIADQQGIFHGAGRDDESLHQGSGAEQEQDDGDRPLG